MFTKVLQEATRAKALDKNIKNFIGNDIEDDDDIIMSLVNTSNANKPDSDEIDEDTLMQMFQVLGSEEDEFGFRDLADDELVESFTEEKFNETQAAFLIAANKLYEAYTGMKGWDRDSDEFCEACGKELESCKEACKKKLGENDDEEDCDDEFGGCGDDDEIEDMYDDDDELFEQSLKV